MSKSERIMGIGLGVYAAVSADDVCADDIKEAISVPEEQVSALYIDGQGVLIPLARTGDEISEDGTSEKSPVPLTLTSTHSENSSEDETIVADEHCADIGELEVFPLVDRVKTVCDYSDKDVAQQYAVANHLMANDQVTIVERIYDLLYKSKNTNVMISIGKLKFNCQKIILLVNSEYFSKMPFLPNEVVLPQDLCPAHGFQLLYRWMINEDDRTKCFGLNQLVPLWLAAQYLQVMQLLRQLWYCFDQLDNINEDIALAVYESAVCYGGNASLLQELMLSHITKIFMPIVACKATWVELSEQQVYDILTKAYLAVNSEVEIFLSILYWLEHDWPARFTSAVRLMSTVRFRLFPIWYLTTVNCVETSKLAHCILKIDVISHMIEAATNDIIAVTFQPSNTVAESNVLSMDQTWKPRCWIVDPQCNHHHMRHCANFTYPKYEVFKSYLREVRERKSTYCNSLMLPELAYAESMSCCTKEPSSLPKKGLKNALSENN